MRYFAILLFVLGGVAQLSANSLWSREGALFTQLKEHQKGDIITVVIVESASAQNKTDDEFDKKVSVDMRPNLSQQTTTTTTGTTSTGSTNILASLPILNLLFDNEYDRERQSRRNSTLKATISAKVTKVLPNGNLEIEGKKHIKVNNEISEIVLKGTVKPDDIAKDNTVSSHRIADASISYSGDISLAKDPAKRGILDRIFGGLASIFF